MDCLRFNNGFIVFFVFLFVSCNVKSQKIPIKLMDINSVIQFEKKLNSKKEETSFSTTLATTLYPYASNYSLTQPYQYLRTESDIHINPKCEYYFDSNSEELKFFTIKWELSNEVDFLALNNYSEFTDMLKKDLENIKKYSAFFKKLNVFLSSNFGEPIKNINTLPNISENAIVEGYVWENENTTVKTNFQYPKENKIELTSIKYTIYWK